MKKTLLRGLLAVPLTCILSAAYAQNDALSFSGSGYIDCGTGSLLTSTSIKTLECWVKFNSLTGSQEILSRSTSGVGIEMLIYNSGLCFFVMNGSNASNVSYPTSNLSTGVWYHIAAAWDGSTKESMAIYVNGKPVGTRTDAGNINTVGVGSPSGSFKIGEWSDVSGNRFFNGTIDEARVWSVTRTAVQIRAGMYGTVATSTAGLSAYYTFNDGSGTTLTNSTANTGLNGTLSGTTIPTWVSSPIQFSAGALNFDGVNDQVIAPANAAYNLTTGSVEIWAYPTSFPSGIQMDMVGVRGTGGTRYSFHLASNQVGLWNGTDYVTIPYTFTANQWYQFSFVTNGSTTAAYVNGTLAGTFPEGFSSVTGLPLTIGISTNPDGSQDEPFNGSLDEVRIWSTQLTPAQITANLNNTLTGTESGLVGLFSFDQGNSGNSNSGLITAVDNTSGENDATVTNFALTGSVSNWVAHTPVTLPVQFAAFTAVANSGSALLRWETAQEQNSRSFTVQRSTDNRQFAAIGQVDAAGNSSAPSYYSFIDPSPVNGNNFYRLLEADLDGLTMYSPTAVLNFQAASPLRLAPNPADKMISCYLNSGHQTTAMIMVTDLTGRKLISRSVNLQQGYNQLSLDISSLPAGGYVFRLTDKTGAINSSNEFEVIR